MTLIIWITYSTAWPHGQPSSPDTEKINLAPTRETMYTMRNHLSPDTENVVLTSRSLPGTFVPGTIPFSTSCKVGYQPEHVARTDMKVNTKILERAYVYIYTQIFRLSSRPLVHLTSELLQHREASRRQQKQLFHDHWNMRRRIQHKRVFQLDFNIIFHRSIVQ